MSSLNLDFANCSWTNIYFKILRLHLDDFSKHELIVLVTSDAGFRKFELRNLSFSLFPSKVVTIGVRRTFHRVILLPIDSFFCSHCFSKLISIVLAIYDKNYVIESAFGACFTNFTCVAINKKYVDLRPVNQKKWTCTYSTA